MALYKEVIQEDGVTTNYHRILQLIQTVNKQTTIAVLSYVNSFSREIEKTSIMTQPYCKNISYELAYDESMTIADAYGYLKTLPQFEGATDV